MQAAKRSDLLAPRVSDVLTDFVEWLDRYGEKSWDFQSFFAGPVGGRAKALYYRHKLIGTAAVAPMIFCEAFLPGGATAVPSSDAIPDCGCSLCDGLCFPLPGDRRFIATGKRGSFSNRVRKIALRSSSRNIAGVIHSTGSGAGARSSGKHL